MSEPEWKRRMVPLTRQSQFPQTPEEAKAQAEAIRRQEQEDATRLKLRIAWAEFKTRWGIPEHGSPPHWRTRMRPLTGRNPRDELIEDFQRLRMEFEPPVPPEWRDGYGPPPSDPRDRLYEHQKKTPLLGLAAGVKGVSR